MTGFGAASRTTPAGTLSVELRSVNSRHLKLNFRMPAGTDAWEAPLRDGLAGKLKRGNVDVTVRVAEDGEEGRSSGVAGTRYRLDESRLEGYLSALRRAQQKYDLAGELTLELLSRCDRLLIEESQDRLEAVPVGLVLECVQEAAAELVEMRRQEGRRLEADLRSRLAAIERLLGEVETRTPARLEAERDRLRLAVRELSEGVEIDEERLAREIAILADRWDISEEAVRARSHLQAFAELLEVAEDEPVGKRLGFLSQELLREVNTIGAKANDAAISHHVVEAKNELESMREQIENVE